MCVWRGVGLCVRQSAVLDCVHLCIAWLARACACACARACVCVCQLSCVVYVPHGMTWEIPRVCIVCVCVCVCVCRQRIAGFKSSHTLTLQETRHMRYLCCKSDYVVYTHVRPACTGLSPHTAPVCMWQSPQLCMHTLPRPRPPVPTHTPPVCFPASVRLPCPDLICEPDTGAPLSVCSVRPIETHTLPSRPPPIVHHTRAVA